MIRDATESDLSFLAKGMVRLQNSHVDAFPDVYKTFSESEAIVHLTELLSRQEFHVRVLIHANEVAGHAVLAVESTPASMFKHAQRYGHLIQIEVDPEFRHLGVGRLLVADVDEIAGNLGLDRILLDVWAFNDSARSFFASCGYNAFGSRLVRKIKPDSG